MVSSVGIRGACAVAGTRGFVILFSTAKRIVHKKGRMLRRWAHIAPWGVVFFWVSTQLDWTMWGHADLVEVGFRSSKGDQLQDGTVMTCNRADRYLPLRDMGEVVELMIELLSSCLFLPSYVPLAAFGTARGNWSVWTQALATAALRGMVALARFRRISMHFSFLVY